MLPIYTRDCSQIMFTIMKQFDSQLKQKLNTIWQIIRTADNTQLICILKQSLYLETEGAILKFTDFFLTLYKVTEAVDLKAKC